MLSTATDSTCNRRQRVSLRFRQFEWILTIVPSALTRPDLNACPVADA